MKVRRVLRSMSRRDALRAVGEVVVAAPLALLWGCEDDAPMATDAGSGGSSPTGGRGGSGGKGGAGGRGGTGGQGGASGSGGQGGATSLANEWATGGTAAMTALASYRNPFADGAAADSCDLTCQLTEGPCHDDQAPEREDISEGEAGLPMRLGLRILDANCEPIAAADVDIWHCDSVGVYSSETADNPGVCTGDNQEALKKRYFRGHRATDDDGVVWFSSCFPGWYSSRAIHIHFTVRRGSDAYLTSQLAFSGALIEEICGTHPDYNEHGQPDTPNTDDSVFSAETVDDYVLSTEQTSDGALLAWKTIIIRSSTTESVCSGGNSSGPGGMGGPPP